MCRVLRFFAYFLHSSTSHHREQNNRQMAAPSKDFRYSVEFNIHAVDAPGTRLTRKGDLYLNVCLLGMHKRTRLMPPYLPMHIDQKLYFDKIFKFCHEPQDIIQRLDREHVLIELIQSDIPSPVVLASYEASARDFLYPYSWDRIEYTGLRRYILLVRTIDFPGISPSFEFSTSPSFDDVTGLAITGRPRSPTRTTRRARSPTVRAMSSNGYQSQLNSSGNLSRSLAGHTISSAVKNDHGQREAKEKLRELAVNYDVNYVTPVDKTRGRPPFVVRHVDSKLIERQPKSHQVLSDGLVVDDYTLARADTSISNTSMDNDYNRSRSISPVVGRKIDLTRSRTRSPSPTRRSLKLSQSADLTRSHSPTRSIDDFDDDYLNDPNVYSRYLTRSLLSPTLHRDSFRYRYRYSPANDLSEKVIHTLQRNINSYIPRPIYRYYPYYSTSHLDDDEILERSRRLTSAY